MVDKLAILRSVHVKGADVDRVVAKSRQERDGVRRDAGIGQEAHDSGAERMQLVLGQGCRVAKRLPDVHQVEIGQIHDDLLRGHAVGHEVHDVRNRDPQPSDGRSPPQQPGNVSDSVESRFHTAPS